MQPFLILMTWMSFGIFSAVRFGPDGSWPIAMMLGPLWLPVAVDIAEGDR